MAIAFGRKPFTPELSAYNNLSDKRKTNAALLLKRSGDGEWFDLAGLEQVRHRVCGRRRRLF
jgi:hypothetical protein